jgi:DNA-binding IclR family transcriptional regulator
MIDALARGLYVLEYLARHDGRPVLLREVVAGTGIVKPNAARILQTLTELGYVKKPGPRQGYLLGPMSHALGQGGVCERQLQRLATPLVEGLAEELGEAVALAVVQRGRRHVLCLANGHSDIQIRHDPGPLDDLYRTATGRLLMAWMSDEELRAYLAAHGLPGREWDGIRRREDLQRHLEAIRNSDEPVDASDAVLVRLALPVRRRGKVVATLGLAALVSTFTDARRRKCVSRLRATARRLARATETETTDATA